MWFDRFRDLGVEHITKAQNDPDAKRPKGGNEDLARTSVEEVATRAFAGAVQNAVLPEEFGRYRIRRKLGQGGMGTVYVAFDTQLDREVALKAPHFGVGEETKAVERFKKSALAAAAVIHPNLCPILDVGEFQGTPYLTMPLLEGEMLAERLKRQPTLAIGEAAAIAIKLARGMQAAHDKGILHRDLTPANVMIAKDGTQVIMDFGLARREGASRATSTGQVLGTPGYVAPEAFNEQLGRPGQGADIYSLGVLLYEMLTGQPPFGRSMQEVLRRMFKEDASPPSRHRGAEVFAALDAVCLKAIARDPRHRFATMGEFADALAMAMQPAPPGSAAIVPEAVQQAPRPTEANARIDERALRAIRGPIIAVATLAVMAVVAIAVWRMSGPSETNGPNPEAVAQHPLEGSGNPGATEPAPAAAPVNPKVAPAAAPATYSPGLIGEYFSGPHFQERVAIRTDALIDDETVIARTPPGVPGEFYSARWTGVLTAPAAASKTLIVECDDGARLQLDDKVVINAWFHQGRASHAKKVLLTGGPQKLALEYNQYDVVRGLRLAWQKEGGAIETIPAEALAHRDDDVQRIKSLPALRKSESSARIAPAGGWVEAVAFVDDDKRIVTATVNGRLQLWDASTGTAARAFRAVPAGPLKLHAAPGGASFVSAGPDDKVRVWRIDRDDPVHEIQAHVGVVRAAAFLKGGKRVISLGADSTIKIWNAETGLEESRLTPSGPVAHLAVSPDGQFVVAGQANAGIDWWDVGQPKADHPNAPISVGRLAIDYEVLALAPRGDEILRADHRLILRYNARQKTDAGKIEGNLAWPTALAFSLDGKRLISGGWDTTVRVIDWPSGRELKSFVGHRLPVRSIAASADGRRIVSGSKDGSALVWEMAP